MKNTILLLTFLALTFNIQSQSVIKIWDGTPPTSNEASLSDPATAQYAYDPDITVYLPDASNNKNIAVIICPGGGYSHLAIEHEGYQFAEWLKKQGYTAIVLRYRLPNQHKEVPLSDVQQAFRYVRSKAREWNIKQIGIAGFSAGGHLASTASTHYIDAETRPDFSILFYPVITMEKEYRHDGSRINLIGENPPLTDFYIYSNEKQVNVNTPPTLLLLSDDDKGVLPQNSIMYYQALKQNDIPATMYIFPTGGHGWGMKDSFEYKDEMLSLLNKWLEALK